MTAPKPDLAEIRARMRDRRADDPTAIDDLTALLTYAERAEHVLKLIDMEWRTDPMSTQCFDSRIINEVRALVQKGTEHAG